MKNIEYRVSEENDLIKYLSKEGIAKNKIKTYIKLGFIKINHQLIDKLPITVKKDDIITITKKEKKYSNIEILYEDKNYCIVNKEAGLLTIHTEKNIEEETLYERVREYLNKKHEYAFIVNRIDRETSGIVIFVKNEKLKKKLQDNWNKIVKERKYIAIVNGQITKSGRIDNYLYEDKTTMSHSTKIGGKRAITNYRPIKNNKLYTMLDINIETGRNNQIRVHMKEMNHPIIGDKKYGSKVNPIHRLGLHHYQITWIDPISKKEITIKKEIPKELNELFSNN